MAAIPWSLKGPHLVSCNCDYGCPCQFLAPPTDGTCRAVVAWRIDEGHFGDIRLDGLKAAITYGWPGPIHKGDGSMQSIIDERANPEQRAALNAILQGEGAEPGTLMLQIYRAMCSTVHDTLYREIQLEVDPDERTGRLAVPGLLETTVEPIRNQVTGAVHRARIDLPNGKEFNLAEVASGTTRATGIVPLEFTNTHAHLVYNRITSAGPAK